MIPRTSATRGFTLVEMMVIAPIVILLIGSFIALIVNLTGEVLSSRGSNILTYDVQNALNRIEQDTKLSTTFLATNNITLTTTKQGYGGTPSTGSTTAFTNADTTTTGGSPASLILNSLVTNKNPLSPDSGLVYLANKPNNCTTLAEYSKNTPMTMNIVYFVDANNTLWRRVVMPSDYASAAVRCGTAPWQIPSCINGYTTALSFCKSNDERLADGVSPSDFSIDYYTNASSTSPVPQVVNPSYSNSIRGSMLQSTSTIQVSITAKKTIAGRDISRSGTLRVTRLDGNASGIAQEAPVTAAPATPVVTGIVKDGHRVTFTWPRVATANSYDISYRINGGVWTAGATGLTNNNRTYTVVQGEHTDTVEARVLSRNVIGASAYGSKAVQIPLWAPIPLTGNWTAYQSGYSAPVYTKTKAGQVLFKGMIKRTGNFISDEVFASIPSDYSPSGRMAFGTSASANVSTRIDIAPTGTSTDIVTMNNTTGVWLSLDNVRYIAASAGYTRNSLTLQNGYTNIGGAYSPAGWIKDSVGRVYIEGFFLNGTRTAGTTITTLPADLKPIGVGIVAALSAQSEFDDLGITTTPAIATRGSQTTTTGFHTMYINYLPASTVTTWTGIPLTNSWADYGSGHDTAQYTKTSDGVVQLKGLVRNGTNTYDTTIGTLPAGFRPKHRILLATTQNADAYARVDILPSGEIRFMGNNVGYFSLGGLSFVAEQ